MNRRELLKSFAGLPALACVKSAEVMRPRPGDTIVLTAQHDLCEEDRAMIREQATAAFPDNRVIVLENGMDIKVVSGSGQ